MTILVSSLIRKQNQKQKQTSIEKARLHLQGGFSHKATVAVQRDQATRLLLLIKAPQSTVALFNHCALESKSSVIEALHKRILFRGCIMQACENDDW